MKKETGKKIKVGVKTVLKIANIYGTGVIFGAVAAYTIAPLNPRFVTKACVVLSGSLMGTAVADKTNEVIDELADDFELIGKEIKNNVKKAAAEAKEEVEKEEAEANAED